MTTYLTDIKTEVGEKLTNSLKNELGDSGLTQAVKDAIREYSRLRPRRRRLNNGAGLAIVAGTDAYNLPADFISWEPESWARATEVQGAPINVYDGRGYGRLDRTPPTSLLTGRALFAQQSDTAAGASYTVYPGNPPQLVIDPVPAAAATLKCDYYALHVLTEGEFTVPPGDWGLIVLRGLYEAYTTIIRARSMRPVSFEAGGDGNSQRVRMADPDKLQENADKVLAEFNRQINRPMGVLG